MHVTLCTSTCATLWPRTVRGHAEEANGELEAEQLLRVSSLTKCRSRIMGLCFGGAATGAPCETCRRTVLLGRAEMHGFFAFALRNNLPRIADGVLSDVCAAMKSLPIRCNSKIRCACRLRRDAYGFENWNGREQCEGVRRGRSCVQHPHADAGAPLHDDRVLLPWGARVTS